MMKSIIVGLSVLAVACQPEEKSVDKAVAGLRAVGEASLDDCPEGGFEVGFGIDSNGDGELSEDEVTKTMPLCHGEDGEAGVQGATGPAGPMGPQGSAGVQGIQGSAGVQGNQGSAGVQGDQGAAGVQGDQGLPGAQGASGIDGSSCGTTTANDGTVTIACTNGTTASIHAVTQLAAAVYIVDETQVSSGCGPVQLDASCAPGDLLLSGGCDTPTDQWYFRRSIPSGNSWSCRAISASSCLTTTLLVRARCLAAPVTSIEFDPTVVASTAGWVNTGISINSGDTLSISATGLAAAAGETPYIDPDGNPWVPSTAPNALAPSLQRYALIGRIGGAGAPFLIGSSVQYESTSSGTLELTFNDESSAFGDNTGSFTAVVTVTP